MRTYGRMQAIDGGWLVTEVEPHVALRMKNVFPRISKTARPPFEIKGGDDLAADLVWFLSRYPLALTDADRERLHGRRDLFERGQADLLSILAPTWTPPAAVAFKPGRAPYPYQAQAAEMARRLGRLLIMDDVGLGKTISALAALSSPDLLPAAVVVQAHLAEQWKEDYIEDFTTLRAHVIKGTKPYALPPADVYVFRYSNMAGWIDYVHKSPFRSVIFDEVQELRHGTSTRKGIAAQAFTDSVALKIGLSATPIYNYGSEIFAVMQFIAPGALGSWGDFTREWCTFKGGHTIVENPAALGTYLRENHLAIRRVESDVGDQMPPVNTVVHQVPFDEKVAADSEALARQLALKVTTGSFVASGQAAREFDALMRHTTGVAKARHVAAFVDILLGAGTPVMLMGWHRDVYDIWTKELARWSPALYTGSETSTAKDRAKAAFIEGHTPLLIMSLRSGAGIDGLQQRGSTVVFGELDWSPLVHKQVIGRLRRPGQTRQVDAIYLTTDGGSDPAMVATLGLKASQSQGIVDPFAVVADQHSDVSRIKTLAEAYLRSRGSAAAPAETMMVPPAPDTRNQMELFA